MRKSDIKKFDKLISLKSNEILHTFLELVDGIFAIYDKKTDSFSAFDVQDTECRVIEETTFTDWYNESISVAELVIILKMPSKISTMRC